jgi:hypothetical protein
MRAKQAPTVFLAQQRVDHVPGFFLKNMIAIVAWANVGIVE